MTAVASVDSVRPQHLEALERANRVRLARASLKRHIADGELSVAEVILTCPWEAERMPVAELLASQHRWGAARCRRALAAIPISERKELGALTERQRHALAAHLLRGRGTSTAQRLAAVAGPALVEA